MKKRKAHRRKKITKRSDVTPIAGASKEKRPSTVAVPKREDLGPAPSKKEVYKREENGVFAPKRYFIVARQFLLDAKVELKKVTWPTRKELLSTTAVVLILVFLIAFFLGIVDLGLVKIIKNVVR